MNISKSFHIARFKRSVSKIPGYLLLILMVSFIFVLIGWVCFASVSQTKELFSNSLLSTGIHIENFIKAFKYNNVGIYFINSVIYSSASCIGSIIISAPCAYWLARVTFKGNRMIQSFFVSTLGVPQIMLILPLFAIAAQFHLINSRITLIFLYSFLEVPFTVFFLIGFFANIPAALEEAAAIDGCGQIRAFWSIMFPLAQQGIITIAIFNFINIWNEFFIALVFVYNNSLRPLALGLYAMVNSMLFQSDFAGLFASVVIVFVPTFLIYILLSEKIIAGITQGGVKG